MTARGERGRLSYSPVLTARFANTLVVLQGKSVPYIPLGETSRWPMTFDEYKHAYYYTLKNQARRKVASSLNQKIKEAGNREAWDSLTICSINSKAIEYARLEWPKHYSLETHLGFDFSWERLTHKFQNNPAHFDLAIWQSVGGQDVLQGLALGKPSSGKKNLNIHWIERSFAPNYFRGGILLPILACAEEYAKLLGSEQIVIKNAVDPAKFERYGYAAFGNPKDCQLVKEISHV